MQYKRQNSRLFKSHVVYEFCCPTCNAGYIGKTDWNWGTRIKEHCGLDKNSPIFNHLTECNFYRYTLTLHSFSSDDHVTLTNQDILGHIRTTVTDNMKIIDKSENWAELCFMESLNIKWKKPSLNTDIKATKELVLFSWIWLKCQFRSYFEFPLVWNPFSF